MNSAELHLLFNHFPVLWTLLALILMPIGLILKNQTVVRISLCVFIVSALLTIPAFLTGEPAEEIVEELPGISHDVIHHHEEEAETAAWFMYILGGFSMISLFLDIKKHRFARAVTFLTLILGIAAMFLIYETAESGGDIRHSEIDNVSGEDHESHGHDQEEKQ